LAWMSRHWKSFWEGYRRGDVEPEADLFAQVGRTVEGVPITSAEFELIVRRISERLALEPSDTVFDYCCGNGLITHEVAARVRHVIGIDFAEHLIEVARSRRQAPNVEYHVGDALEPIRPFVGRHRPNKYLMSGGLSYFGPADLGLILRHILEISGRGDLLFFIAGVPDVDRKWNFYDTPERRAAHREEEAGDASPSGLGRWWSRDEITDVARAHGLDADVAPEPPDLNDYRMEALIR
jgi:SAM-dependent methyltransferase